MKKMTQMIAMLLLSSGVAIASTPVEIKTPIENIYSPNGFDSNDNVEIIIEGFLPNLCHKSPTSKVEIVGSKIKIDVTALRYDASNPFCPEAIVPFVETVNVGLLDKGNYDIIVNGKSIYQKNGSIEVAESTSNSVDEHVYANVDSVMKESGSREVELRGYTVSDCFVLDEINIVDNGRDVYSVLPKMKQISDFCPQKMVPFSYKMEVPSKLKRDKVLLHVRGMNGNSVNSLFYNK
ncbi:MAG: hypothetical protein ACJAT2_001491 [Bacteriovoracaceae bacterium]|jgi:hypothetical protein